MSRGLMEYVQNSKKALAVYDSRTASTLREGKAWTTDQGSGSRKKLTKAISETVDWDLNYSLVIRIFCAIYFSLHIWVRVILWKWNIFKLKQRHNFELNSSFFTFLTKDIIRLDLSKTFMANQGGSSLSL